MKNRKSPEFLIEEVGQADHGIESWGGFSLQAVAGERGGKFVGFVVFFSSNGAATCPLPEGTDGECPQFFRLGDWLGQKRGFVEKSHNRRSKRGRGSLGGMRAGDSRLDRRMPPACPSEAHLPN